MVLIAHQCCSAASRSRQGCWLSGHLYVCLRLLCNIHMLLTLKLRRSPLLLVTAIRCFKDAVDKGLDPMSFVEGLKKQGKRVPGIGHRIKSKDNRDKRVELLQGYARKFFPGHKYLDYALTVEEYTLQKAANLVLNVDGCIAALFLDLLGSSGGFSQKEMDDIIAVGYLNGLFVLARSIGLIGHTLDQKRLQQPLYRHPWEDVLYTK
eukprot:GHRR01033049.1.p1 GENE.GHRR01033049.1~~GHRR01033049.1.p1  ORF type:complete len:207 (+),score=79.37 GHRR01033049.1:109-729(+)